MSSGTWSSRGVGRAGDNLFVFFPTSRSLQLLQPLSTCSIWLAGAGKAFIQTIGSIPTAPTCTARSQAPVILMFSLLQSSLGLRFSGCVIDVQFGAGTSWSLFSDFWPVVDLLNIYKKEVSLMRYEDYTYDGYKEVLGGSWKPSFFSTMAIEVSLPGPITSPAVGSWVVLQY